MNTPQRSAEPTFEIVDMLKMMWRRRLVLISATVIAGGLAWGIAKILPKKYDASVLVAPVGESSGGSALASMLRQFGGLASLTGLTSSQNTHTAIEIATLKSNELTEKFIKDNNLLPVLFPKEWNKVEKRWKTPDHEPTLWDGSQYFSHEVREIQTDRKTGLVLVKVRWTNPKQAAAWANSLVGLANSTLRQRAIDESKRNIDYLQVQGKVTDNVQLKSAIDMLMFGELQNAMVAQGEREYAFRVVDPAVAPEKPSSPKTVLWTLAGIVLGFSMSSAYALLDESWKAKRIVSG